MPGQLSNFEKSFNKILPFNSYKWIMDLETKFNVGSKQQNQNKNKNPSELKQTTPEFQTKISTPPTSNRLLKSPTAPLESPLASIGIQVDTKTVKEAGANLLEGLKAGAKLLRRTVFIGNNIAGPLSIGGNIIDSIEDGEKMVKDFNKFTEIFDAPNATTGDKVKAGFDLAGDTMNEMGNLTSLASSVIPPLVPVGIIASTGLKYGADVIHGVSDIAQLVSHKDKMTNQEISNTGLEIAAEITGTKAIAETGEKIVNINYKPTPSSETPYTNTGASNFWSNVWNVFNGR
jgi:hypothetical protein